MLIVFGLYWKKSYSCYSTDFAEWHSDIEVKYCKLWNSVEFSEWYWPWDLELLSPEWEDVADCNNMYMCWNALYRYVIKNLFFLGLFFHHYNITMLKCKLFCVFITPYENCIYQCNIVLFLWKVSPFMV